LGINPNIDADIFNFFVEKSRLIERDHFEWLQTLDSKEWDDFVVSNWGSVFHLWAWRTVLENDGSRALYMACRDSKGKILAVCPFLFNNGKHFSYLDSLPDSPIAGPLVSRDIADMSPILALLAKSVRFSLHNPVLAFTIRTHVESIVKSKEALGSERLPTTHGLYILDLAKRGPDDIWKHEFRKHDRQAVKYYEQHGLEFEISREENALADYAALERPDWGHFRGRLFQT
jgi:hypothetical protein